MDNNAFVDQYFAAVNQFKAGQINEAEMLAAANTMRTGLGMQPVASIMELPEIRGFMSAQQPATSPNPPPASSQAPIVQAPAPAQAPQLQYAQPPVNVTVNTNVQQPAQTVVVMQQNQGPGCLVRALWFLCIGLWLGLFVTVLAWTLNLTILGLPLGLALLNRLPQIMTLKPAKQSITVVSMNGMTVVSTSNVPQYSFLVRALYFVFVGSWFSAAWLLLAWGIAGITLGLGLPVAFWMFDRVPAVTTLAQR